MRFRDIRVGQRYWCVLKTTLVDPDNKGYPDFLIHLAYGYVTSKGLQRLPGTDNGTGKLFVEIAGQRVNATHLFTSQEEVIAKAGEMMTSSLLRPSKKHIPKSAFMRYNYI